jgi:hypothetical protein
MMDKLNAGWQTHGAEQNEEDPWVKSKLQYFKKKLNNE